MPSPTHPTVDLRSDTLTRPTEAMRRAMASADVGDDVYGEDPSAAALEARSAELLGKEAALFVPSGTMANQIALLLHCRPGDEVVVGRGAHLFYYEGGAGGAWAGVQFLEVGTTGLFTAEDVRAAVKPLAYWLPRTRAVAVENTHNRSGGRVFPEADFAAIAEAARSKGLALHVDGARIWNAAVATGKTPAELTKHADTVSACFSKGLGAPVGSVIAGTRAHIDEARRFRRMLGGAMRQVGVLCAAATYAIEHHIPRLAEDHANAKAVAKGLAGAPGVHVEPSHVETNIVNIDLLDTDAESAAARLKAAGVLLNVIGPQRLRAVTHLDVTAADITRACDAILRIARDSSAAPKSAPNLA